MLASIAKLGDAGRVDPKRVMILRTGSNYSMPAPGGLDAAADLTEHHLAYSALQASLDAAFLVGGKIVEEISGHWDRYADAVPGSTQVKVGGGKAADP